jgi:hypothetical protein
MMREQFAIPQILAVTQVPGMQPQVVLDLLPSLVVESPWPTSPLSFAQSSKAAPFEAMHPTLNRSRMFAEPVGDVITAMALTDEQYTVESMVVTRLIGTADLLLQGYSHRLRIGNLKCFHAGSLRHTRMFNQPFILHYL